jgi:hypothetical protein
MPLHHPRVPFAVAWTPKAGCTSLTKWFLFHTGDLTEALQHAKWIHRYRIEVFEARDGYGAELLDLVSTGSKPLFKLVRNPYDRAVSSFLHVLAAMEQRRLNRGRRLPLRAQAMFTEAGFGTAISFRQFLETMKSNGLRDNRINQHLNPQYRRGEESMVSRFIRLENFDNEIRALEREFALAVSPLDLITRSAHHRRKSNGKGECLADTVFEPGSIMREETPAYESFYNERTRTLVRELYDDDFGHYGYAA